MNQYFCSMGQKLSDDTSRVQCISVVRDPISAANDMNHDLELIDL